MDPKSFLGIVNCCLLHQDASCRINLRKCSSLPVFQNLGSRHDWVYYNNHTFSRRRNGNTPIGVEWDMESLCGLVFLCYRKPTWARYTFKLVKPNQVSRYSCVRHFGANYRFISATFPNTFTCREITDCDPANILCNVITLSIQRSCRKAGARSQRATRKHSSNCSRSNRWSTYH